MSSTRAIILYGQHGHGQSARPVAEMRAREIASALQLRARPKLMSSRTPEMLHGMRGPVVLAVVGELSDETRRTLAMCEPVFIDDRVREAAQP